MVKDRICGTEIDEEKAKISYDFFGVAYYFCSTACRDKFAQATVGGINP